MPGEVEQLMFDNLVLAQGFADPSAVLYGYGPLGVFALASGLVIWRLFKRLEETLTLEREGRKRAEDEVRALNTLIREQHVPALTAATAAVAQAMKVIQRRDDL